MVPIVAARTTLELKTLMICWEQSILKKFAALMKRMESREKACFDNNKENLRNRTL